ncbi:hypothetical protein J4212_06090 [Candidatus Woesearchaeota archaeon]|nr:hypothetical protein [Candidatus Woesearchaeota archaeon]
MIPEVAPGKIEKFEVYYVIPSRLNDLHIAIKELEAAISPASRNGNRAN